MPKKFLWHMQNRAESNKRKTERFFELTIKIKSLCYFFCLCTRRADAPRYATVKVFLSKNRLPQSTIYYTKERNVFYDKHVQTKESGNHLLMTFILYRVFFHLSALFLKLFHIFYYCQKTFK